MKTGLNPLHNVVQKLQKLLLVVTISLINSTIKRGLMASLYNYKTYDELF
jgi:hypothetical protein